MAQDYLQEGIFTTESSDITTLDDQLNIGSISDNDDIIPATAEDKKVAATPKPKKEIVKESEEELPITDEMEEDVEDTPKKSDTKPTEKPELSTLSEMGAISEGLFKAGIWSRDEDEDEGTFPETEEEFVERFDYETKKVANDYVTNVATRFGEEAKELFDAVFIKGVPIKDYVSRWQDNQDFKSMDMTIEENQVRVIETMLKEQGIPEEKIREKVRKLKLAEDLEEEANTYHGILIKKQDKALVDIEENSRRKIEQKRLSTQQFNSTVDTLISDKLKVQDFDGIPVNPKTAEIAKDILKTQKWKLKDGTLATDWDRIQIDLNQPMNYDTKVKLALLFKPYIPEKPLELNIQAIGKKAVSQENTKLFNLGSPRKKSSVPEIKPKEQVDISDLWK